MKDAKSYQRSKIIFSFFSFLIQAVFLISFQAFGGSGVLKSFAKIFSQNPWGIRLIYLGLFFLLSYFVSLPLRVYSQFIFERKYELSNETLKTWAVDELKKFGLSFLFFISLTLSFYWLVERFPLTWWAWAGFAWLGMTVVLIRILPTVLIPIFYPLKVLEKGALKTRIWELCRRCGVKILDVYQIALSKKTKKANAALVGLGRSRRVLLGDTLLSGYSEEEVAMVVAHELGHHAKRHILKIFILNSVMTLLGFFLLAKMAAFLILFFHAESLADPALLPVLLLLSLGSGALTLPLQNAYSRILERQADDYALSYFPSREVFISMMNKLAVQNLADPDPPVWLEFLFYDHPSISHRIERVQDHFKKNNA